MECPDDLPKSQFRAWDTRSRSRFRAVGCLKTRRRPRRSSARTRPTTSRVTAAGTRHTRSGRFARRANVPANSVHPDWIAVHEEIAAASFAVLGEMHQRASTVVDVNRRHPTLGLPNLQHAAASHDRLDDAFPKPRAVAVNPPGQRGDDRQAGDDVSVEAIEGGREAASPRTRAGRVRPR